MNYAIAYAVGFHPWEDAEEQSDFNASLATLLGREEADRGAPYGRALDVGTGSGIWGIELARRGWRVTGVDVVARALRRAVGRIEQAGVEMDLVEGDVTALRGAALEPGFELVLDTGTFHGLTDAQRAAMGKEVDALAADDATVLVLGWKPKRRGPFPRGASRADVECSFPGWKVEDAGETGFEAPRPIEALLNPEERWYRLTRR